jgi:bacteriocin biosynthesis cyclodehydratase domain-containing protein
MPAPARPTTELHPAARLLWRSANAAQIELGSRRVVLDNVDSAAVRHLIGRAPVAASAAPQVAELQRRLLQDGYVWPGPAEPDDLRRVPPRPRLAPELTALSARVGQRAAELINARAQCSVAVQGAGRIGPHLASLLAAAGVGRCYLLDTSPARLQHAMPGGVSAGDEGSPLAAAAASAVHRHAPEAQCTPVPFGERPDLVVLALDEPIGAERRAALHADERAHLLVQVSGNRASIGPLVLPGLTSCLRCADLHRLERDPAWNALAVQLALPHRASGTSEVALATIATGLATAQVLQFLDGGRPATVEGTLEMDLPDYRVRRRSWPVHPDCDCMAAAG